MKHLLSYFKPYIKESILAPLFKLLEAVFELLVPMVIAGIVDQSLPREIKVIYGCRLVCSLSLQ